MEIAEIKERLPLADVLARYGLEPDAHGRLRCPFHKDRTPSMQVYFKTGTCYCFSTNCPTHGSAMDVVDLIMHQEGTTKHEAILKAKGMIEGGSGTSETSRPPSSAEPAPSQDEPSGSGWERRQVLERVLAGFKWGLPRSKRAKAYMEARGLDLSRLEAGYNSGQFHQRGRREEGWIEALLEAGLLLDKGQKARTGEKAYRVFAKDCICFPLKDAEARVAGLYFRSTIDDTDQRHFYLKDRQGLYPGYPDEQTRKLILTESVIDAASLLQQDELAAGYGVLALYGTNGLTAEHKEAVRNLPSLEELIFFLNGDEAGRKATQEHAETLREMRPDVTVATVDVPEGEDVNSLLQAHDGQVLLHLIEGRSSFLSNEAPAEEGADERKEGADAPGCSSAEREKEDAGVPSSEGVSPEASGPFGEEGTPTPADDGPEGLDARDPKKLIYRGGEARYTVLGGLGRELDRMRVTLRVEAPGGRKLRTRLDLYEESQVEKFAGKASAKLELERAGLDTDLFALTDLLEEHRERSFEKEEREEKGPPPLTAKEREELEAFAKEEGLTGRIEELLGRAGIVGEERTRTFLFLVALSHKLEEPLHALIQGSSGSGKTRLLQQIAACMPEEKLTRLTRVSEKAFYNYPEEHFVNRLLCLEDMDGLGEEATFAFRELQSNGELTSSVSYKDEDGRIGQAEKRVKGPVASLACTTNGEIYEDNMSRCFLVAVDERAEQTERITEYQDRRAAGEIDKEQEERTKAFLQKFVRFLAPYEVRNPYAGKVRLPGEAHKVRRLNELFQSFIGVVTVLHQYQRERDEKGRLIATKEDVRTATGLMLSSILLKVDELDGSLRQFFERLKAYVEERAEAKGVAPSEVDFTRFEVREATGVAKTQQHHHIRKLVELEYLRQHGHANRGYSYRIARWDDHAALKERIRKGLEEQLEALGGERERTPDRTPEPASNGEKE